MLRIIQNVFEYRVIRREKTWVYVDSDGLVKQNEILPLTAKPIAQLEGGFTITIN
jgi:hypothetical protein